MREILLTIIGYAFLYNIILSTGFGSSVMLQTVRTRRNILPIGILMCVFSVLTTVICYPLDQMVDRAMLSVRNLRPLIIVVITAVLYIVIRVLASKLLPALYQRISRLLPLAAFNNLVIGVAIIVFMRESLSFALAIATAFGASLGFLLLSWITGEGMSNLDNPNVPKAFRGLPVTFIFLGILALSTMGWDI